MAEKSPGYQDANPNSSESHVPHSGKHHGEKPVVDYTKTLEQALEDGDLHIAYDKDGNPIGYVPNTLGEYREPENSPTNEAYTPLVETKTTEKKPKKGIAAITAAALATTLIAGLGASKLFGGDDSEPRDKTSNSAGPVPGPEVDPNAPVELTVEQKDRQDMLYTINYVSFVDEMFYQEVGREPGPFINQPLAEEVVQDILNNFTYIVETDDPDGILATFKSNKEGDYGLNNDDLAELLEKRGRYSQMHEMDPSYPITNLELVSLDSVNPNPIDPNLVNTEITVLRSEYGDYVEGESQSMFTYEEKWVLDLEKTTVTGWSDGGERTTWLVSDRVVHSTQQMS